MDSVSSYLYSLCMEAFTLALALTLACLASFGVNASFHLHGNVLRSVFRAPMSFFDTTPTGRILSRFSKDIHTIDHELADYIDIFLFIILQLAVVLVSIVVITPLFAATLPFVSVAPCINLCAACALSCHSFTLALACSWLSSTSMQ